MELIKTFMAFLVFWANNRSLVSRDYAKEMDALVEIIEARMNGKAMIETATGKEITVDDRAKALLKAGVRTCLWANPVVATFAWLDMLVIQKNAKDIEDLLNGMEKSIINNLKRNGY